MTWANQTVEATAPRRLTFVRHHFQNVLVSGGRALPGAVPHLDVMEVVQLLDCLFSKVYVMLGLLDSLDDAVSMLAHLCYHSRFPGN